jgi:alpha-D-ribose 1-methylphosphonate 5-triphosphate diphosphatase
MTNSLTLRNAKIVLADEIIHGSVQIKDGLIVNITSGPSNFGEDFDGDLLIPGLVEIHTDNLERHLMPRPKVRWPAMAALLSHDAEIAAAGITTVFDALGIGDGDADGLRGGGMDEILSALEQTQHHQVLRADHHLHIRCELPAPNTLELFQPFAALNRTPSSDGPHRAIRVGLLSLMDHTPGQRQWSEIAHARTYFTGKKGWSLEKFERHVAEAPEAQSRYARPNRSHFIAWAREHGVPVASHDDTTPEHVAEAVADGIRISEFPTTLTAAQAARSARMLIVMGGPNVVRGGSHSGNVAAADLARAKLLDALSSDYVPGSLMLGALRLVEEAGWSMPEALCTVSLKPAQALGLNDRGMIASGLRADLVRVHLLGPQPAVRAVWRQGQRVC